MIKITFVYNNRSETVDGKTGETLLQLAQRTNIPLFGGCGGAGICGSCCVEIDREHADLLLEPKSEELDTLDSLPMLTDTSRLACQVILTPEMDGMVVTLI